jgi:hypothetical protein
LRITERYAHFSPDVAEKVLKNVESFGMRGEQPESANVQADNSDVIVRKSKKK